MTGTHVTFFISTGRCATQWFADKLALHYGDLAEVAHEPFQEEYRSRAHFVAFHEGRVACPAKKIEEHLDHIERVLQDSHYIETGWPAYGVLPLVLERFGKRARIVHLYRDPLPTAASHTTHDLYSRGDWSESILLFPGDPGVAQKQLAGPGWSAMSEFEKCLFWCTELNDFAFRLHERFDTVPWHPVAFEDVFATDSTRALVSLLDFLDLPSRESFLRSRTQATDRWSLKTSQSIDLDAIDRFPKAREVRHRLGFDAASYSEAEIRSRYRYPFLERVRRRLKRLVRRQLS